MTLQPAGTELDYTVTWLEMTECPSYAWPALPSTHPATLLHAEKPPVWYFLALYDAVGRDYAWEDMHKEDPAKLQDWLNEPTVALYTLLMAGWPHGFFLLDARAPGETELVYFGLVPEAVGQGLGTYLLKTAILTAWGRKDLKTLAVNTCTLDHPRALAQYQKNGFKPVRRESRSRTLARPRDLSRIPD